MTAAPCSPSDNGREQLELALREGRQQHQSTALLMVSVLGLDAVRAVHGRHVGTAVRAEVHARLTALEASGLAVVPMDDDDVAVICRGTDECGALRVAERILELVATPTVGERGASLVANVGVAVSLGSQAAPEDLLQEADSALTYGAARGPGAVEVYHPVMSEELARRLQTAVELRETLGRGTTGGGDGLFLHYQPVVDLVGRSVVGAEALVRWRHPERGLIPPGAFIPVAERVGLITDLGRWVLDAAAAQLAAWQGVVGAGFRLHVNLSPAELHQPGLVSEVSATLDRHQVPPDQLLLEITETGLLGHDEEPLDRLDKLRATGVSLGIDDFGTGYSSISYLRDLPVDVVKLDRSLTTLVSSSPDEYALARAIFGLVRSSGLEVVAEGIEEHVQVAHLRSMRCRYGQGFLLARPGEPERITELLRR